MSESQTQSIEFKQNIAAPPSHVYFAWTKALGLREWLAIMAEAHASKIEPFFIYLDSGVSITGRYSNLKKDKQLTMSWRQDDWDTTTYLDITLTKVDEGTQLELVHRGLGQGEDWTKRIEALKEFWQASLLNLSDVLTTGFDRREFERPMLGIWLGGFISPEFIKENGVPVDYGHVLQGVLSGMGADLAGLRKDDVILTLNGIPLKKMEDFGKAVKDSKAGDMAAVEYFREGQVIETQFELARRSKPDVPPNAVALADSVNAIYQTANAQVQEMIAGASSAQIDFRPAVGEWNVKDILAHMIITERHTYQWVNSIVKGSEVHFYGESDAMLLQSVQHVMPQAADLFKGLQQAQQEGVYVLTNLPSEFVSRKAGYVKVAAELVLGQAKHYQEHLAQIQENLEAAQVLS